MPDVQTSLLIIGAGPFGLAMAARARQLGIDHVVVGRPMSFWKRHMPAGMLLRSGCDWHLDPAERKTIKQFIEMRGETPDDVQPLSLQFYLQYGEWFMREYAIVPRQERVKRLDEFNGRFEATLDGGGVLIAKRVLLALGFAPFAHIPENLAKVTPVDRSLHTCDCAEPNRFNGRRVLIVGGRQSAFEFAALLAEAGAKVVHICHRHPTPAFEHSDWDWVGPLLERTVSQPGWFRGLTPSEQESIEARFWEEGRLRLEPWLEPRVHRPEINIRPLTEIVDIVQSDDSLQIRLSVGDSVEVDHILYATGYQPDLTRVPFLQAGNLLGAVKCLDGSPVLDDNLQTTMPGLFATSLLAARDFGPFFAFTAAACASAHLVARGFS